jgi:hypothetical protein
MFFSCILDKKKKINEREMLVKEKSSFLEDYKNMFDSDKNSFHFEKGILIHTIIIIKRFLYLRIVWRFC